jgi:hypothetical protein
VGDAVAQLDAALTDPKSAGSRLRWALKSHFHTEPDATEVVQKIRDTLAEIQAAFGGEIPLECETECDPRDIGYTGGLLGIFPRGGHIHLCPRWFEDPELDHKGRAETILHEMGHRYAGKSGFNEVYRKDDMNTYAALSTGAALGNADSFAQFARTLQP